MKSNLSASLIGAKREEDTMDKRCYEILVGLRLKGYCYSTLIKASDQIPSDLEMRDCLLIPSLNAGSS